MKFLTHRISLQSSHPNFQKIFGLAKYSGHFELTKFHRKMAKHKNAYISKIVHDITVLLKFMTHRVSLQIKYHLFPKIFISPKMAAILNLENCAG